MRKIVCATLVLLLAWPTSASAWGFAGHRLIMRRAIDLLPPELKPFFDRARNEIVLRVIDPDLWRKVGWEDGPHHFLDFGGDEYGPYPFTALPREYKSALAKFGLPILTRYGLLPWREAEEFDNLQRAFAAIKRDSPGAAGDVVLFTSVASHYIQDAYQPLHATLNNDGQLTRNFGIHARFETNLVERYESTLKLTPAPPKPMTNARDAAFDALTSGYLLVDAIMKADTEAVAGKDVYDDDYFTKLFAKSRGVLEQRLSEAITATASLIVGAWEQAGKPALVTGGARPADRVQPPR